MLIAWIGSGPVFLVNGVSFIGVILSLVLIRKSQLVPSPRLQKAKGQIRDGLRYVRDRKDILVVLVMVFLVGTFGFNFPIFISTMSTVEFGKGSAEFGLLSSVMAVGAVAGSLLAARRERVRFIIVVVASGAFGLVCAVAALSPTYLFFAVVLVLVGVCSLTMMNTASAYVQTTTAPAMRGRVMALYMAIFAGGTPIGAPIVGLVANVWGPRWSLAIGAASGILAALIAVVWLSRKRNQATATAAIPVVRENRELATEEIGIVGATAERTS